MIAVAIIRLNADVMLLAPDEESFVPVEDFFISFRITGNNQNVRRVKMFFDNEEISSGLRITGATVSFIPDKTFIKRPDLAGPHTVTVLLYGPYKAEIERKVIKFYLHTEKSISDDDRLSMMDKGKTVQGVTIEETVNTGKIYTGIDYNSYQDSGVFAGILDAYGNGYRGEWFYNYNVSMNTQEDKRHQTLQRFRFATGYTRSLQMSIGDNWPAYNYYVLDGQCLRGIEFNLKTPKQYANLDFVVGKTKRSIDPYLLRRHELDSIIDSDTSTFFGHNDSVDFYENGTYRRRMWAARLHFGTGKVFKWGFSMLKAKDDTMSIEQRFRIDTTYRKNSLDTSKTDTIIGHTVLGDTPKDNIVVGSDITLNFWKRRIALFSNFGYSLFTENILGGAATQKEISDVAGKNINLAFQPKDVDHIFIVNSTTVPLPIPSDPGQKVNMGSLANACVLDAGVRFLLPVQSAQQMFEFKYFFIGPNFHSLGNEYLSVNKAGIQCTEELRLFNGKIFLKGDLKYYKDDLHSVKTDPTRKVAFNFLTTFMWSGNLPYITFMLISNDEMTEKSGDTILSSRDNGFNQIGTTIQYTKAFDHTSHTATLSYNYNKYDSRIYSAVMRTKYSLTGNNGLLMITSTYKDLPIQTRAGLSGFLSQGDYSVNRLSPSAGITWNIQPRKMYANVDIGFEHINDAAYDPQNYWSVKSSFNYDISERHSLYAEAGLNRQLAKSYIDPHFQITYEFQY